MALVAQSSANAATVTINRSGSTYRSAGITTAGYLYPGATNTFTASATNHLDFTSSESFTFLAAFRQWATQSNGRIFNKRSASAFSSGQVGYEFYNSSATQLDGFFGDGVNQSFSAYTLTQTLGANAVYAITVNRSTNTAVAYYNNTVSSTGNISSVGNMTNVSPLSIGRWGGQASNYADMEFVGAALFRSNLTPSQIRQITNYFANREVYL
jgi:hypothetical protein